MNTFIQYFLVVLIFTLLVILVIALVDGFSTQETGNIYQEDMVQALQAQEGRFESLGKVIEENGLVTYYFWDKVEDIIYFGDSGLSPLYEADGSFTTFEEFCEK